MGHARHELMLGDLHGGLDVHAAVVAVEQEVAGHGGSVGDGKSLGQA